MKVIGVLLVVWGVIGIGLGLLMVGDIGLAAIIGATAALLSGIGFLLTSRQIQSQHVDSQGTNQAD